MGRGLRLLGIAVLGAVAFAAAASGAWDGLVPVEKFVATGEVTPKRIPSRQQTPVTVAVSSSLSTEDGSHPKPQKEVEIDFDRHLHFDFGDVPRCRFSRTVDVPPDWQQCDQARIGGGTAKWEVALPEEEPFRTGGRAILYKTGPQTMVLRSWVNLSFRTEVWIPLRLGEAPEGRYRHRAIAEIPTLAGGSGSLTRLSLRFREGLFSATCPRGRLQLSVAARFVDGMLLKGTVIRPCGPRG